MQTSDQFLSHFRRQRRWTLALVVAVPEEHFDWRPEDGGFSCGELVRHLIQAEMFWTRLMLAIAAGEEYDPFEMREQPGAERLEAFRESNLESSKTDRYGTTFAECLTSWAEIQRKTEDRLARLTSEQMFDRRGLHPLSGLEAPLWEFLVVFLEHEAHHRGQLSAYLKMLGVDQPAGLWS